MEITNEEIEALERILHYLRKYSQGDDYATLVSIIERLKSNIKP